MNVDSISGRRIYPPPFDAPVSALHQMEGAVRHRLQDLSFTPIIGAECSTIGRTETAAWRRIASEITWLLLHDDLREGEEEQLLKSLARWRGVQLDDADPPDPDAASDALRQFRVVLVMVAAKANVLFGDAMKQTVEVVGDIPGFKVRLLPRDRESHDREFEEFTEYLILACVAARKLQAAGHLHPLLGAHGIYDRLTELTAKITNGWISPIRRQRLRGRREDQTHLQAVLHSIGVPGSVADGAMAPVAELYLHQLEWLTNLLWHTLRFDVRAYPANSELAFQISLDIREEFDRSADLPPTAQLSGRVSAERLREWLRSYRPPDPAENPDLTAFYDGVARILIAQSRTTSNALSIHDPIDPVALSTTFDLELEQALLRSAQIDTFHVAVPIVAKTRREPHELHLRWLLGTLHQGDSAERPHWEWFQEDSASPPSQMRGPLVAKLQGSPLHDLPEVGDPALGSLGREYLSFEHAQTLSESEYLFNIVHLDAMPTYLKQILREKERAFFILGPSLDGWSGKLRLYDHVFPGRERVPNERRLIAIKRSFDPYDSAVLSTLGIERWTGELEHLTELIGEEL